MKIRIITLQALLLLLCPLLAMAQLNRSESFKSQYKLKEVVILSRHNIRSSLSVNGSTLPFVGEHSKPLWVSFSANGQ